MWHFKDSGKFCSVFENYSWYYRNIIYPLESHHLGEYLELKVVNNKKKMYTPDYFILLSKLSILFFQGWKIPFPLNIFLCDDKALTLLVSRLLMPPSCARHFCGRNIKASTLGVFRMSQRRETQQERYKTVNVRRHSGQWIQTVWNKVPWSY